MSGWREKWREQQGASDDEKRSLIRRNLQWRREEEREQEQQQREIELQAQAIARSRFEDEEFRVHMLLKSEARWFLGAICVTLAVAALANWEYHYFWAADLGLIERT